VTWTPVTQQSETWTETPLTVRGFDPNGFDRSPRFDTGSSSGVWDQKAEQPEVWSQS
jgi:hypothetical protein